MVRLIMGVKGSGKTKQLIELINNAAKDEPGNVVCIEANRNMTYDIHYHIRLIDAQEYKLKSFDLFRGFISGLYAGNYDISHVFIDNLLKTVGQSSIQETEEFLNWLDVFGERNNIKFTVTISALPRFRHGRDAEVPVRRFQRGRRRPEKWRRTPEKIISGCTTACPLSADRPYLYA